MQASTFAKAVERYVYLYLEFQYHSNRDSIRCQAANAGIDGNAHSPSTPVWLKEAQNLKMIIRGLSHY
jgi:hypothetical protein